MFINKNNGDGSDNHLKSNFYKIHNMNLWTEYDNSIGCRVIKGPLKTGSYSILDIYEIDKKIILTWDETFTECYKKMKQLKGEPKAIINCLNFGHPKDTMGDFKETIVSLRENCRKFKIPVIGGNVSLYNCTDGVSISPTPILVMIGVM